MEAVALPVPQISEEERGKRVLLKGIGQIAALVILFLMVAFGGITYNDGAVNISLNFFDILNAMFLGGQIGYNLYGTVVMIEVPVYVSVFYLAVAVGIAAAIVCLAYFHIVRKKDSMVCGWLEIGIGGAAVLFYFLLLFGGFLPCRNYSGEEKIFYQLYEVSILFLAAGLFIMLAGFIQLKCDVATIEKVKKYFVFYLMLAVPTVFILIFSVYPIYLQVILSFKNYTLAAGIWGSAWNGLENFIYIFTDSTMLMVIWQTVYLSFLRLLAGVIPSVIFALVLYHITSGKYRGVVQTVVYIPHFFSWVVIYAIVSAFFLPDGVINNVLVNVFGSERVDFLSREDLFYFNMIWTSVWKETGWGTILYMAALMGIDKTLYDAAAIDGAGVWKKLTHITLPGMIPILVFQVVMAVGNILKGAVGEQILIFATSSVKESKALVIDTWLYWYGLNELQYGVASAMSFVQSAIGFVMVIGAHNLSKKLVGIGAW